MGDDAGFISEALNYNQEGLYPANLYKLTYCFILKYITNDPIIAHYLFRYVNSFVSVLLIFFLLKSFKFLKNDLVIILCCIFWGINNVNMPYVQFGNINIFSLNLVLPALILIIRQLTLTRVLFLLVSFWLAACVRIEYLAPLILFSIYFLVFFIKERVRNKQLSAIRKTHYLIWGGLIVLFLIPFFLTRSGGLSADRYLRLGLNQCYTCLYVKMNPNEKIDPMLEYSSITDDLFGKSDSFVSALIFNPAEVLKYLMLNGAVNLVLLVPTLLQHHGILIPDKYGNTGEIIEITAIILLCVMGTFIAVRNRNINIRSSIKSVLQKLNGRAKEVISSVLLFIFDPKRKHILFLLFLAMSSSVAVLLLIPHSRYWVSCIPLLLVWVSWSISQLFEKMNHKAQVIVFIIFSLLMSKPIFLGIEGNRPIIEKMRSHLGDSANFPLIVGHEAIAVYAFGNKSVSKPLDSLTPELFTERGFDFLVIDGYKKKSLFWTQNQAFLNSFEQTPEKYGYFYLEGNAQSNQLKVFAKRRQ